MVCGAYSTPLSFILIFYVFPNKPHLKNVRFILKHATLDNGMMRRKSTCLTTVIASILIFFSTLENRCIQLYISILFHTGTVFWINLAILLLLSYYYRMNPWMLDVSPLSSFSTTHRCCSNVRKLSNKPKFIQNTAPGFIKQYLYIYKRQGFRRFRLKNENTSYQNHANAMVCSVCIIIASTEIPSEACHNIMKSLIRCEITKFILIHWMRHFFMKAL